VMSETPTDTELVLKKKPYVKINLLTRSSPHGPSGVVERLSLASNPDVPRQIDRVVSDMTFLPTKELNLSTRMEYHSSTLSECSP